MKTVNIHEAKTHLSQLLRKVQRGEEIIIAHRGQPIARLLPIRGEGKRVLGSDKGLVKVADDFNAPLPFHLLAEFEK